VPFQTNHSHPRRTTTAPKGGRRRVLKLWDGKEEEEGVRQIGARVPLRSPYE